MEKGRRKLREMEKNEKTRRKNTNVREKGLKKLKTFFFFCFSLLGNN